MNAAKLMAVAQAIAGLSKDPSTQVGALIIGPQGDGGPWGFNGAPRGSKADELGDPRGQRPEKYFWFEHAERNAIYAAARSGYATAGCSMVVTHPPCMDCARAMVQAGIKHVIVLAASEAFAQRWHEHTIRTRQLFDECGISLTHLPDTTPMCGSEDVKLSPKHGSASRCDSCGKWASY